MYNVAVYQELDVNIDALLAGAEVTESADGTMRELMAIARELRAMPSPEFRERLAEELDEDEPATWKTRLKKLSRRLFARLG